MKTRIAILGLAVGALLATSIPVDACGDKYLVGGRNRRYDRAVKPSNILIYRGPTSDAVSAVLTDPKLQRSLQDAGHTVVVVNDLDQCVEAIESEGYDLVLANYDQASLIEKEILGKSADTLLVPVFHEASKETLSKAKDNYRYVINTPNKRLDREINKAVAMN